MNSTTPIPSRSVQLFDENGALLRFISAEEATRIMQSGRVFIQRTTKRVHSLRYLSADRGVVHAPLKLHYPHLGEPHRRESETNVKGVWTFDRLRDRGLFTAVLASVMR